MYLSVHIYILPFGPDGSRSVLHYYSLSVAVWHKYTEPSELITFYILTSAGPQRILLQNKKMSKLQVHIREKTWHNF